MLLGFRTSTYARNIYYFGVTSFSTIPVEYVEAVKQLGAERYTDWEILKAKNNNWITEQEYNDTMAYKQLLANNRL